MRSDAHRQPHHFAGASILGQRHSAFQGIFVARDDNLPRSVVVSCLYNGASVVVCLAAYLLHSGVVQSQDGGHAAGAALTGQFHQPTTLTHQPQPIGKVQRPCRRQRRVFPQAVTSHEGWRERVLWPDRLECVPAGDARGKDGGLGVEGIGQRLLGALKAEARKGKAENMIGLIEHFLGNGIGFIQVTAHTHFLCSLAWKEIGHFFYFSHFDLSIL